MKRMALMALSGLAAAASPALADDIPIEAPIESVTVYPLGAAITREGPVTLPAGTNVIILDNLPVGIDTSSIRVGGLAGGAAQIQSVSVRRGQTETTENPERDALIERLEDLRDDLQEIGVERAGAEAQRQFINNLIEAGPAGFAQLLGGGGGDPGIDLWRGAWEEITDGILAVERTLFELEISAREIEAEIDEVLDELSKLPSEPPHLEILIEAATTAETDLVLEVSYRINNAGWAPAYDVTLTTGAEDEDPMVEVVRRAEIYQNTGEDWTDVALTLSTTRPSGGTDAPTVGAAFINVYDNNRLAVGAMPAPAPALMAPADTEEMADGVGMFDEVSEQQAIADFGDFRADYVIPTPVSIASGAGERSVRIATDEAVARLFVEVAPRFAEEAFLTAAFTLESEAPMLAGEANLFRDDAYVGTGRIAFASPGAEIEIGFGVDDQVRATWTLADRNTGERGLLSRVTFDERQYLATIINNHTREIEITVVDRVPIADDDRITVERLPEMTEPTEEDYGGRRGVVAWTYTYEPGETREIVNAYAMTWPADLDVYGAQ